MGICKPVLLLYLVDNCPVSITHYTIPLPAANKRLNIMMKQVVLTGTSQGIGQALAAILLQNGYKVTGTSRQPVNKAISHPHYKHIALDLADMHSIEQAAAQLQGTAIDLLINNAAIGSDLDKDIPEPTSFGDTFRINVTGTVFFTEALLPLLQPEARLINISSKMGSISICAAADSPAYRMSKAALNMYSKILQHRLQPGQKIATLHPGWVRTALTSNNAAAPLIPDESAAGIFDFIESNFANGVYWNVHTKQSMEW